MHTFMMKKTSVLLVILIVLAGVAFTGSRVWAAPVTIDLCASNGQILMPDGVVVNVWGFVQTTTCGPNLVNDTNFPGPVLPVFEGDTVTINITNALPTGTPAVPHTISFEIPGIAFDPGPTDAVVGATVTRTFTANAPGTYLYQSGGDAGRQEAMGLYGALIVRPTTSGQAYDSPTTAYDVEATLVLSAIDPNFNAAPDTYDMYQFLATYWLINGKAYPNTAPINATVGQRLLLRYLNAGYDNTTMQLLGMHEQVLARDANLLNNPFLANAETFPAGSTEDVIAIVPASAPPSPDGFPLYNRQLHLTNGSPGSYPGGMMTFITTSPPVDQPPTVNAGLDQTITLPASASLDGTVTDDGLSPLTTAWTMTSGPGTVTFGNASLVDTSASFSTNGVYVLRLTATDGTGPVFDEVTVTVNPAPTGISLYFSTLANITPPGLLGFGDDADIYTWNGTSFAWLWDASTNGLPANANADGLSRVDDTHFYLSFVDNTGTTVPGLGTVQDEDVVFDNNGTWSVYFDGTALGLTGNDQDLDAIDILGGTLYFSLSGNGVIPTPAGCTAVSGPFDDADIYSWDGTCFARVWDATNAGLPAGANVDGLVFVDSTHFYLSFNGTSTTLPGLGSVADVDVVYNNAGSWSVYFDGVAHGLIAGSGFDIDAFDLP